MMFKSSLLVAACLIAATSALPSKGKKCSSKTYVANYDDLTFNPLLPAANTITSYKGLKYNAFAGAQTIPGQGGTLPHSGNNEIVTGFEQTITDGTAFVATPSGSTFDLTSFYYGCSLNAATSTVSTATSCVVKITGYDSQGRQKASQEFNFTPTGISSKPSKAKPSYAKCHAGFTGVSKVEFTADPATTNALDLDDLSYTIHKC